MDLYSRLSAEEIIPIIFKIIKPKSVIDVGCGVGTWLDVFKKNGVKKVLGIDGSYVNKKHLVIPEEEFLVRDLRKPIKLSKKFDLVLSLEVAEHLPKECAETFIYSLTKIGDIILFSAAIPYQGGTNHLNEQWQDYWAKLFKKRDYLPVDFIRKRVWNNQKVKWFYSQNVILYVKKNKLYKNKKLKKEFETAKDFPLSIVHPKKYELPAKFYNNIKKKIPKNILKILRPKFTSEVKTFK